VKRLNISNKIDYTLLKPEATIEQIKLLCKNAIEKNYASVCVAPSYVKLAKAFLKDSDVKVCTVIGFPLGSTTTHTKTNEALEAIKNGVDEIDVVVNIGAIKSKMWYAVLFDLTWVTSRSKKQNKKIVIKVIIETCLLTTEEKVKVCKMARLAGVDFIKTSTGLSTGGATVEDIKLIRETVGNTVKIKASGGIKDYETAVKMIEAGADRIGTSALL
jgi:deoxyribose-phosphate aldolase